MQQILNVWSALDPRKRLFVGLATLAMFAAILGLGKMAAAPNMTLLYAGLEAEAAGDVIQALETRRIVHEVRGGAIFVDAAQRDSLRMTLASEGLPANNARGYELLDSMSGFGTTSQMFDAAYWRAKEGELARTIVASPHISAARVHIANTGTNPFQRDIKPSASVTVTTTAGAMSASQARALKYLVASAVAAMQPEDVAIIDGVGGLIAGAEATARPTNGDDRSDAMRDRVMRLIEARVGAGNAMVELSIATETESESIRERRVDPSSRVAISTDTEETSTSARNATGGDVTVASNLPDGDAGAGDGSNSTNSESRERVNYEISETSREVVRAPGTVKRITVAVLVNGVPETTDDGVTTLQPRPDDELAALRDLVASAVGFDETRGDVITLKSMAFQQIAPLGTQASNSLFQNLALDAMSLIQMAVLAIVALILGLFVLRPILSATPGSTDAMRLPAPAQTRAPASTAETDGGLTPLTGEISDDDFGFGNLPMAMERMELPSNGAGAPGADPVERLRALIAERQDETVEILRGWLEDREEKA